MSKIELSKWQDPEDGFPSGTYFDQVVIELEKIGIGVIESDRTETWEFVIGLDWDAYANGPFSWATEGLWVGWRCSEESEPLDELGDEAGFRASEQGGPGWYYAPYSKPGALADFVKDLEYAGYKAVLRTLAEPDQVAAAVKALVSAEAVVEVPEAGKVDHE